MRKSTIIAIFAFILVLAAVFLVSSATPSEKRTNLDSNTADSRTTNSEEASSNSLGNQHYIEYSPESLEASRTSSRLLFFYANWCPTCRPVDAEIKRRIDQIPEGITIIRVNYNDTDTDADEEALAEIYGITYQHTFVLIDENGNELRKWNGGDFDTIIENISS